MRAAAPSPALALPAHATHNSLIPKTQSFATKLVYATVAPLSLGTNIRSAAVLANVEKTMMY